MKPTMNKQLTFISKRQIKDGVGPRGVWVLYGYTADDNFEYSSFEATYPLNTPLFVEIEEVEVPSRDGKRTFVNRKLIRVVNPKESKPQKVNDQGERIIALLEELQTQVADVQSAVD